MQSSSSTSTFLTQQRQQQQSRIRSSNYYLKDYQLNPQPRHKSKPKQQRNPNHRSRPKQQPNLNYNPRILPHQYIQDLRPARVILHRLKLPVELERKLQQQRQHQHRKDKATQTIDPFDQQVLDSFSQVQATTPTSGFRRRRQPSDSSSRSLNEDDIEEIIQFILMTDPKRQADQSHTSDPDQHSADQHRFRDYNRDNQ